MRRRVFLPPGPKPRVDIVRPLAPAVEEARRERARQHLQATRRVRGYEALGQGRLQWRHGRNIPNHD